MKAVCLSDTHGRHGEVLVPEGDLLLHAGDLTGSGEYREVESALGWLASLPHRHKVFIAGNHDFLFQEEPARARRLVGQFPQLTYLEDEETTVEGLRIWGSPWQPWFFDWAFNLRRGPELRAKWALIPDGIDLLVTHGPPMGVLDAVASGEAVGCADLFERVRRLRPRLHVFGHIHESHGRVEQGGTVFVNASICDLAYDARNPATVVELAGRGAGR